MKVFMVIAHPRSNLDLHPSIVSPAARGKPSGPFGSVVCAWQLAGVITALRGSFTFRWLSPPPSTYVLLLLTAFLMPSLDLVFRTPVAIGVYDGGKF
jgi:hypothetical protein